MSLIARVSRMRRLSGILPKQVTHQSMEFKKIVPPTMNFRNFSFSFKKFKDSKTRKFRHSLGNDEELEEWEKLHEVLREEFFKQKILLRGFMVKMRSFIFTIPGTGVKVPLVYTISNLCGHGAFFFLALSYLESNFFSLRLFAASGITLSILFQYYRDTPLWIPIRWNALFLFINIVMLALLILEAQEIKNIPDDEMELYLSVFKPQGMTPSDFLHLMNKGTIKTFKKGDYLIQQGKWHDHLYMIQSGSLTVDRDKKYDYHLKKFQFVGEMSYLNWKDQYEKDHASLMTTASSALSKLLMSRKHVEDEVSLPKSLTGEDAAIPPDNAVDNKKKKRDYEIYGVPGSADVCCDEDSVLIEWTFRDLQEMLDKEENLAVVFERCLSADLFKKMKEKWIKEPLIRYKLMMTMSISSGEVTSKEKEKLLNFRRQHGLDDSEHAAVLREMGWTEEDIEVGYKG
mmetsp:Transcript_8041/g.8191  ORF Transcript_8041/g.8191 Transcript_8041/m.8191 type:complete len:457 (+) Transcript_8041:180-1550(+)